MGCCSSKNEVTPLDTPVKKRPLKNFFKVEPKFFNFNADATTML